MSSHPKVASETPEQLKNPVYLFNSHCQYITNSLKEYLLGRFLTIIDSTISDNRQNKATKDLVRQIVWEKEYITEEFKVLIEQFVENYCPELKNKAKELGWDYTQAPHPSFFGDK